MSLKRFSHFKKNRRVSTRQSPESLNKNAITLLRLFVPSLLCFIAGISFSRAIGAPFQSLYEKNILSFFLSPFYGVKKPFEYLFRILFFSSPHLIKVAFLFLSLTAKKRHRAVCKLLAAILFFDGLYYPILLSLYESARLTAVPFMLIRVYESTELSLSTLFFVYAYRLTRCFSYGFPNKAAPPHIVFRFLSYTARLLFGIVFLVTLRTVIIAAWIS